MPTSIFVQALLTFAVIVCLFALWKGGRAERTAGVLILVNTALFLAEGFLPPAFSGVAFLLADVIAAFGLLAVTLRYGNLWLGGAMLLYAVQFSLHAYYFVADKPTNDLFHARVNNLNFLGIVLCLGLGVIAHLRRPAAAVRA